MHEGWIKDNGSIRASIRGLIRGGEEVKKWQKRGGEREDKEWPGGRGGGIPVGEGRLHEFLLHPQVLKAVVELGIGHLNAQLLEHIRVLGVKVEAHLGEPLEGLVGGDSVLDESPGDIPLVHRLYDL